MPDLALLSIPAYWAVVFYPHMYAMSLVSASNNPRAYNNAQARDSNEAIAKALGPVDYARFTRAKSAHYNGNESFPLFAIALLAGKYAGLDMTTFAVGSVALRAAYVGLYIGITDRKASYARTAVWVGASLWALGVCVQAALQ